MKEKVRRAGGFFICLIVSYFIGSILIGMVPAFLTSLTGEMITIPSEWMLVLTQGLIIIPGIIYFVVTKQKVKEVIGFHKISLKTGVLVALFTFAFIPIANFVNALSMLFVQNIIGETLDTMSSNPLLINLIIVAVLPAFCEEFVFRGIIFSGLREQSIIKGAILCGAAFGLYHMNINQFLYAFLLGLVLALLREATGSILAPMLVHFIFNGNSVFLLWMVNRAQQFAQIEESAAEGGSAWVTIGVYGVLTLICIPIAIFLFKQIVKSTGRETYMKHVFRNEKIAMNTNQETQRPNDQEVMYDVASGQYISSGNHSMNEQPSNGDLTSNLQRFRRDGGQWGKWPFSTALVLGMAICIAMMILVEVITRVAM